MKQLTLSDLIVAVMDAALECTHDEKLAAEIASRALVGVLQKSSPRMARELAEVFRAPTLH